MKKLTLMLALLLVMVGSRAFAAANPTLKVDISITITASPDIQWSDGAPGTVAGTDDGGLNHGLAANRITNWAWSVNKAPGRTPAANSPTTLSTGYTSSSATENQAMQIENLTTGFSVSIGASTTAPTTPDDDGAGPHTVVNWGIGGSAADAISLTAAVGGAPVTLTLVQQNIGTLTGTGVAGTDVKLLSMVYTTPTGMTAGAGRAFTNQVTVTATLP